MSVVRYLHLPNVRVHDANAFSSAFTVGFPAVTSFMGFAHALQRKVQQQGLEKLEFPAVGIISHSCDLQVFKGSGDFVHSVIGKGHPLTSKAKRPSFIEEPRCHLRVSLLLELGGPTAEEDKFCSDAWLDDLYETVLTMRIAGGTIEALNTPRVWTVTENSPEERKLLRSLMPGYALVERREYAVEAMQEGADGIDAILDFLTVQHSSFDMDGQTSWVSKRKAPGWLVPIASGFQGISEPGTALNQRDMETEHRFAESIITLGEFVMPHRFESVDEILWEFHADRENSLYLCEQFKEQ